MRSDLFTPSYPFVFRLFAPVSIIPSFPALFFFLCLSILGHAFIMLSFAFSFPLSTAAVICLEYMRVRFECTGITHAYGLRAFAQAIVV